MRWSYAELLNEARIKRNKKCSVHGRNMRNENDGNPRRSQEGCSEGRRKVGRFLFGGWSLVRMVV